MEIQPIVLSLHGRRSKGNGKGISALDHARGRREEGGRFLSFLPLALHTLSRAQIPPSPFNACHAGYSVLAIASPLAARARLLTRYSQMEILLSV